ncbi:MAG: hypothetical protein J0H80_07810, partial [Rhizobiales bacterium]|nr:hypothetical protein [Hyphomicrobiales bacterium]
DDDVSGEPTDRSKAAFEKIKWLRHPSPPGAGRLRGAKRLRCKKVPQKNPAVAGRALNFDGAP